MKMLLKISLKRFKHIKIYPGKSKFLKVKGIKFMRHCIIKEEISVGILCLNNEPISKVKYKAGSVSVAKILTLGKVGSPT